MRRGSVADARLLAYHEAGHAVAAFVLKRPLGTLTLQAQDCATQDCATQDCATSDGRVAMPQRTVEEAERDAIVLLCGAEAEALLTGYCDWFAAQPDWDLAEAVLTGLMAAGHRVWPRDEAEVELVSGLEDDDLRAAWELLAARARTLIASEPASAAIASLAAALLAQSTLSPEQAQRVIRNGIASADPELREERPLPSDSTQNWGLGGER